MLHHGFKPNKAIFRALISANCKSGKVSKAFGVFRSMLALGVLEVRDAYLVLLRALLVNKKMLEAAEVILELHGKNLESQNRGMPPNLHARNHLIAGLFRAGQTERAKMIFDIIVKEGPGPNRAIYTAMISGLAERGRLSEAFGLFDTTILRGLTPRKIIYNALFDGCCKTGNLQKAQDLLQKMLQMGIASTKAFNTLIDGFLKNGNVLETKQLLKKMIEGCVEHDQDTYTMLIESLCLDKKYGEALGVLLEMGEKGFVLNRSTCSAIARSFSLKGDTNTDEVCLVIKAMTRFGWISDSTTFSDLLKDSKVAYLDLIIPLLPSFRSIVTTEPVRSDKKDISITARVKKRVP
ncbi:hypothetical protein RND71_037582 [Anisodus tanguticus]|uniref:Pentatricopeptide repeat-containing protein n=1 Tax=Anisodus tanguticus TaxID=243964 RepID=A0AAE1QYD6_9SOLA|nr:hypothetical protein RND71_037582 [Anisodus tanguticus]